MPNARRKPILNASLPAQFRQIRIELAREPDHPDGDSSVAYTIIAPLDADGCIDRDIWRKHREACRIVRSRPGEEDRPGHLIQRPGGRWVLHYENAANLPDETALHFGDERFSTGEYVSIREGDKAHPYRVTSMMHL
jgi:hypothetical protein